MAGITTDDFLLFLAARANGPFKCHFCGAGQFAVNVDAEDPTPDDVPLALFKMPSLPSGVGGHEFHAITCTNCGNTYFFHVNQIEKWLESKIKEPTTQQVQDGVGADA